MLSVTYEPFMLSVFMLNVNMLSVLMLSVVMLSVVAHCSTQEGSDLTRKYKTLTAIIVSVS
jgi:hypothetical protein